MRARRGVKINEDVYFSGDLAEEEQENDKKFIKLDMKKYDPTLKKVTSFFTNWSPELILMQIVQSLERHDTAYTISSKTWKVSFSHEKTLEDPSE